MTSRYRLPSSNRHVDLVPDAVDDWFPGCGSENPDRGITVIIDGVERGHLFASYPSRLKYRRLQRVAAAMMSAGPMGSPLSMLHITGDTLALARHVTATRPGSKQFVIDDDHELLEFITTRWPLREPVVPLEPNSSWLDAAASHAPFDFIVFDLNSGGRSIGPAPSAGTEWTELLQDAAPLLGYSGKMVIVLADQEPAANIHAVAEATAAAHLKAWVLSAPPGDWAGTGDGAVIVAMNGDMVGAPGWAVQGFTWMDPPSRIAFYPAR